MPLNRITTGLKGLDEIIDGLRIGDNVVFQLDSIDEYLQFVTPYINSALAKQKTVIYMRFAKHQPLVVNREEVITYTLDANSGFEKFSTEVHNIVTKYGEDVYYVFDCLSDLLSAWATDLMIGNFFKITCPYLYELNTIAYFAILRNNHSFSTIARIREITQVLLDVYNREGNLYIHPIKVWQRYSPTMFLPHLKETDDSLIPISSSIEATKLFSYVTSKEPERAKRNLDYWDRLFITAARLLENERNDAERQGMVNQLCQIMIGREPRILALASKYFSLDDLLNIKGRLIGTGYIGGKTVGML
ncbi:MAG: phosphoenolpyruvate synthase, partial [Bacillota bacterium]|nr:phosphoenolpyruvate synthase [Bacillota bacterium]